MQIKIDLDVAVLESLGGDVRAYEGGVSIFSAYLLGTGKYDNLISNLQDYYVMATKQGGVFAEDEDEFLKAYIRTIDEDASSGSFERVVRDKAQYSISQVVDRGGWYLKQLLDDGLLDSQAYHEAQLEWAQFMDKQLVKFIREVKAELKDV